MVFIVNICFFLPKHSEILKKCSKKKTSFCDRNVLQIQYNNIVWKERGGSQNIRKMKYILFLVFMFSCTVYHVWQVFMKHCPSANVSNKHKVKPPRLTAVPPSRFGPYANDINDLWGHILACFLVHHISNSHTNQRIPASISATPDDINSERKREREENMAMESTPIWLLKCDVFTNSTGGKM